jgi:hypothetical protein
VNAWRARVPLTVFALASGCNAMTTAPPSDGGIAVASGGADASGGDAGGLMDGNGGGFADAFPWPCPMTGCTNGVPCANDGCCVNARCISPTENCADDLGVCEQKSCGGCGALNQACCVTQDLPGGTCGADTIYISPWEYGPGCSDPDAVCTDAGTCEACGTEGQLCCFEEECSPGFVCLQAACTACGGVGQPCCRSGYACSDGRRCLDYAGQEVCVAPESCDGAPCMTCGGGGQPCCPGGPGDAGGCSAGSCGSSGLCQLERP